MNKINCPACGHDFHAEEVITKHLAKDFEQKLKEKEQSMQAEFAARLITLEHREKEFEQKKKLENELFNDRVEKERIKITQTLKNEQEKESQLKLSSLESQLKDKEKHLEKLMKASIENEELKRKLDSVKTQTELQMQEQLTAEVSKARIEIQGDEQRRSELRQKEMEKQLEDQKKLIETLQRKATQGSMQLQGEVQELAIEEYLKESFPFDEISEVRKGARGADCIQRVHTRNMANAGLIYYESKRTKDFQAGWVDKLKEDMRTLGADIGVLITQTMPKDMNHMGEKNGVWICSFDEYKALIPVLRHGLIQVASALNTQENKTDKLNLLYTYLTGNDFKMQVESIVEGFHQMRDDLQREKLAMNKIWSQREKNIDKVMMNMAQFYGNVKGIAGASIPTIGILELPEDF